MAGIGLWGLIIIGVILLLVFGTSRFGRAVGGLKSGGRELKRGLTEDLTRSGERVALAVDESLDLDGYFDVAFAIESLTGAALVWLELGELRLPEAKYVWLDFQKTRDVTNLEIETVRYSRNLNGALRGRMRSHS